MHRIRPLADGHTSEGNSEERADQLRVSPNWGDSEAERRHGRALSRNRRYKRRLADFIGSEFGE